MEHWSDRSGIILGVAIHKIIMISVIIIPYRCSEIILHGPWIVMKSYSTRKVAIHLEKLQGQENGNPDENTSNIHPDTSGPFY